MTSDLVVGVGVFCLDTVMDLEQYPEEDWEGRAEGLSQRLGGNALNTLTVLKQLRPQGEYWLASVRPGRAERSAQRLREVHGVLDELVLPLELDVEPPTSVVLRSRTTGSRTIVHYRPPLLPELDLEMLMPHLAKCSFVNREDSCVWLHYEGRGDVQQLTRLINGMVAFFKERNFITNVSIEIEKPRIDLLELIPLANLVFVSRAYATKPEIAAELKLGPVEKVTPENVVVAIGKHNPAADIVCAWGSKGAAGLSAHLSQVSFVNAVAVDRVVDSLGAGDSFIAGYLHGRLQNMDQRQCLEHACQVAGWKIQHDSLIELNFPSEWIC